jgi:hypothetical protein
VNALAGALLLVGAEVASLVTTGSHVAGARLVGGVLGVTDWGVAFAGVAEGLAAFGERRRALTPEEYAWAGRVFAGTLPPRERLVVTDTIGAGERPFTFPRLDGTITLNLGPEGFADPRRDIFGSGAARGETFVHELAHAWQVAHHSPELVLLAGGVACRLRELVGVDPYVYSPGRAFGEYTLEQQAQIVSDWFGRHHRRLRSATARRDPRYRYIEGNIRRGRR